MDWWWTIGPQQTKILIIMAYLIIMTIFCCAYKCAFQITPLLPTASRILVSKHVINVVNEILMYCCASRMPTVWTSLMLATASLSSNPPPPSLDNWFSMHSTDPGLYNLLSPAFKIALVVYALCRSLIGSVNCYLLVSPPTACTTH